MTKTDENDFGVMLRPILDRDVGDPAYGNLEVAVFSNLMPEVGDELHARYMFIAYKMAAVLSFCEDNPEFDALLSDHTIFLVDQLDAMDANAPALIPKTKPRAKATNKMGNVITLDFNTKCEGEG